MTAGEHTLALTVNGRERRCLVHVPARYDPARPVPAVLVFHGRGGTARWALEETGWADTADRETFLAVFPEGTPPALDSPPGFLSNPQGWDVGVGRDRRGDLAFARALLDALPARFAVDPARVCATGFSNGASLVFYLASELAPRLAAVAPVAGHCWVEDPKPARPVPTVFLVGTQDPLVPPAGGDVRSPWSGQVRHFPPLRDAFEKWARAIGCPPGPRPVRDEGGVRVEAYGPGPGGAELLVYLIDGLGHHWPGGLGRLSKRLAGPPSGRVRANDVIWDFFQRHAEGGARTAL